MDNNSKNNNTTGNTESINEAEAGGTKSGLRIVLRDRELLAHVAIAKYLTEAQIQKLVFAAPVRPSMRRREHSAPVEASVARRRLRQLATVVPALLRQTNFRDEDGLVRSLYCVTPAGYGVARPLLKRAPPLPPGKEGGDRHLAHSAVVTDLYVCLAAARGGLVRVGGLPFVWIAESIQLPWREFNTRRGEDEEKRLVPDAILELPADQTRVFIENEMGGHPVVRNPRSDRDSILAKLQRYGSFIFSIGESSFYAQTFLDRWKPELLFMIHSSERASNVARLIADWKSQNPANPLVVRALTLADAHAEYARRLKLPAPAGGMLEVGTGEIEVLVAALEESVATYKGVRHFLRAHPEIRQNGCPYPEYTPGFEQAVALADRLRKRAKEVRR